MPLFGRRRPPNVPEWAAPLSPAEFALFREQVDKALAPYGYTLGAGFVTVRGRALRYLLTGLLQRWRMAEPSRRPSLIEEHCRALLQEDEFEPPSAGDLVSLIRPRLWASEALNDIASPLIRRPIAFGLEAVLSLDLPAAVGPMKPELARTTGRSTSELWEIAYRQIDDGLPLRRQTTEGLQAISGNSMFVASRLLDLEQLTGRLPAGGALVAVPHRHILLVHAIKTLRAMSSLNVLIRVADRMYREGPGSIVPHVYWWRREQPLLRIPATIRQNVAEISPPDEFIELLNGLPS